jgi:hypothetical protein
MNLAGKAGGCGYEQTNPIGKRADGTCSNLDADPRSRTDSASRVHTIARRCFGDRRRDALTRTDSFECHYACSGPDSDGRESQCDRERRDRSASCDGE